MGVAGGLLLPEALDVDLDGIILSSAERVYTDRGWYGDSLRVRFVLPEPTPQLAPRQMNSISVSEWERAFRDPMHSSQCRCAVCFDASPAAFGSVDRYDTSTPDVQYGPTAWDRALAHISDPSKWGDVSFEIAPAPAKCECGVDAAGQGGLHSAWCAKAGV